MADSNKPKLLKDLTDRFGKLSKIGNGQSLYRIGDDAARIYIRYSKVHRNHSLFFGLRKQDLRELEGRNSYIAFISDGNLPPVLVPFADFEAVFRSAKAASDNQYKVQLLQRRGTLELYVAKCGRFNVEGYLGTSALDNSVQSSALRQNLDLTHWQVQTLLGGIGIQKGYEVYIPGCDLGKLDWTISDLFKVNRDIPKGYSEIRHILTEIDVLWVSAAGEIASLFEVEHSTTIYSGLLRFNDVLLTNPKLRHFSIVADEHRREVFARQAFRPTFVRSGLAELTSFLEYSNVYSWYRRLQGSNS